MNKASVSDRMATSRMKKHIVRTAILFVVLTGLTGSYAESYTQTGRWIRHPVLSS